LSKKRYDAVIRLLLKFTLQFRNREEQIEVMGRVVRSSFIERVKRYHVGVRFMKISRTQQDLIVYFILTKLAEQNHLR
jgi:c-di-GMP-binding flagellar brake protein YcgR